MNSNLNEEHLFLSIFLDFSLSKVLSQRRDLADEEVSILDNDSRKVAVMLLDDVVGWYSAHFMIIVLQECPKREFFLHATGGFEN